MIDEAMTLNDEAQPPMANGEIIFEAPWQSRVFGMARLLCEQNQFHWDEFRACLIARIAQWESSANRGPSVAPHSYQYFDHFLAALTDIVGQKGLCSVTEIDQRAEEFAQRPHGHDHSHDHS